MFQNIFFNLFLKYVDILICMYVCMYITYKYANKLKTLTNSNFKFLSKIKKLILIK